MQRVPPLHFGNNSNTLHKFPAKCKGGTLCISANIQKFLTFYKELQRVPPLRFGYNSNTLHEFPAKCKGSPLCISANIQKYRTFYKELQRVPPLHFCYNFNTLHEFPVKCKGGTLCISANIQNSKGSPLYISAENSLRIAQKTFFRILKTIKNALKRPKIVFFARRRRKFVGSQIDF